MTKELTFNFERERIIEYCQGLPGLNEQIEYLRSLLLEYKTNPDLDVNYGVKPTLKIFLQITIYFREYLLNNNESDLPGLLKINGINCHFDIIIIIDAMIQAEMVSSKIGIKLLMKLFFSGEIDNEKNEKIYNERLNEIKNGTNRDHLLEFLMVFIEENLKGNPEALNELYERLIELKS